MKIRKCFILCPLVFHFNLNYKYYKKALNFAAFMLFVACGNDDDSACNLSNVELKFDLGVSDLTIVTYGYEYIFTAQ